MTLKSWFLSSKAGRLLVDREGGGARRYRAEGGPGRGSHFCGVFKDLNNTDREPRQDVSFLKQLLKICIIFGCMQASAVGMPLDPRGVLLELD